MAKASCPGLESLGIGNVGSALFLGSASLGHMLSLGKKLRVLSPQSQGQAEVINFRSGVGVWEAPHWNPISSTPLNPRIQCEG